MVAWKQNKTLFPAIYEAARKAGAPLRTRMRLRMLFAFAGDDELQELEKELTVEAVKAGAIPPTAQKDSDCYVGEWGDGHILDWIIANWDSILKMILSIIALFSVGPTIIGVLIFCGAMLLSSTASAQCSGGVCRVAPVRRVVDRTVTVVTDMQPARAVVKRVVHRGRFLSYRRTLRRHGGM